MPEHDREQHVTDTHRAVARFYDTLRSGALSAAALAHGTPFSIVITDLGMPYVDGRKVAASVKAASALTPVILLTGWGKRLLAENDIPAHVDRVLSKPPRLAELRAALAKLAVPLDPADAFVESA